MIEGQEGVTWEQWLALARACEVSGIEALFRSDHYLGIVGGAARGSLDAWTTLAGLAVATERVRLGTLVSPVTFRIPGPFAKLVATVDEMSGGRIEVGMGAGWNDVEHAELGIPFPPLGERYDMLEEAVAIVHGLWTEPDGWGFDGRRWEVRGSRFHAKPARGGRRHPPIILGGDGGPRLARLAARFADEFNLSSATLQKAREAFGRMRDACVEIGRGPATLAMSAMTGVLIAETEPELRDRIAEQLAFTGAGGDADAWLAERRERWILGTLDEAGARVQALADVGVERIMLQDFLPRDLDMVRLMGRLALA
jgi:F420-dependent oxidoreductase-like protein